MGGEVARQDWMYVSGPSCSRTRLSCIRCMALEFGESVSEESEERFDLACGCVTRRCIIVVIDQELILVILQYIGRNSSLIFKRNLLGLHVYAVVLKLYGNFPSRRQ